MTKLQAYLKLAWACKTPFVFCLDSEYYAFSHLDGLPSYGPYEPELFDCDDFAFALKGDMGHGMGIAIDRKHAWNVALTANGVRHIEPQSGKIIPNRRALVVII